MKIIALMSGSSLDGIDIGYIEIQSINSDLKWKMLNKQLSPYSDEWVDRLYNLPNESARNYALTKASYSGLVADEVKKFIEKYKLKPDIIAWHGHTIFHFPEHMVSEQIGEGGIMASITGVKTITDFRINDIALGGQGTPIAPIVERYLFKGYEFYLNLGGIANISMHTSENILAYDICPANQLLNELCIPLNLEYDKDGELAKNGNSNNELLSSLKNFEYYKMDAPKSLDNNWIRKNYFPLLKHVDISQSDKLSTVVDFINDMIFVEMKTMKSEYFSDDPISLLVTGGGAHNKYLIDKLRDKLSSIGVTLVLPEKDIIDYKETILMALMGYLRVTKQNNVMSSVTGSSHNSIGGGVYIPN